MPFLHIIRPFNCLFVALTVLFGAFFSAVAVNTLAVIAAVISASLIAAGGYVINDFYDLPIDAINKPKRILPSGRMKPKTAYIFAVTLFWLGILISILTQNIYCIVIALVNSLLLFFYAKRLKQTCLIGNLLVAYAAASTFIFGGLANANLANSVLIASFAFLYTLLREFIKDAEDIDGDKQHGAATLAVIAGSKNMILISLLPAVGILFLIQFFAYTAQLSQFSFITLNVLVGIPIIAFFVILFKRPFRKTFATISSWAKIDMLILLITIWIGK